METFADLINEAMARKRTPEGRPWSDYTLSAAIGLLPGDRSFNAKQVWRLRKGERQNLSRTLVERLINVLNLDPAEAWAAAGILPPGVTADMIRRLDLVTIDAMTHKPGKLRSVPFPPELEDADLLHNLGVPQPDAEAEADAERRWRDRRRLHLVRPVSAEQVPA